MEKGTNRTNKENPGEPEKEAGTMKAIGYAAGTYVDYKGNVVDTETQIESLKIFAEKSHLELVTIFEDLDETEPVMERPGIRKMMATETDVEVILVDRVWCIGRTCTSVEPLLEKLDSKGMRLESAKTCFDVTSQYTRFWYSNPKKQAYKIARKARNLDTKTPSNSPEVKV